MRMSGKFTVKDNPVGVRNSRVVNDIDFLFGSVVV